MKNLDIEKIERKNIYQIPDNFFEEMQMKVLAETAPKKEAKIIIMNWVYSAAAAVAMIFGITFFVSQKDNNNEQTTSKTEFANNGNDVVTNSNSADEPKKEAVVAYQTLEKDLTNVVSSNQKEKSAPKTSIENNESSVIVQKNTPNTQNSEAQVDQILANFSSADLADLGKNVEQDVYLDLYN
jgi:flagellar basal body-associated protein FliL